MSTFKKAKIVILPTNEAKGDFSKERIYPCLLKHSWMFDKEGKGKLIFTDSNIRTPTQLQHLYIISDDEIKEGDWCYDLKNNCTLQAKSSYEGMRIKKIIATTDESLYFKDTNKNPKQYMGSYISMSLGENLPQPSQQFIQKYIEEYNKGNVITDVLVGYELVSNEEYFLNTINPDDDVPYFDENLKINPKDNTITIKKVKDSYTREEHISNIKKFSLELGSKIHCFLKEDGTLSISIQDVNKWIEENL